MIIFLAMRAIVKESSGNICFQESPDEYRFLTPIGYRSLAASFLTSCFRAPLFTQGQVSPAITTDDFDNIRFAHSSLLF